MDGQIVIALLIFLLGSSPALGKTKPSTLNELLVRLKNKPVVKIRVGKSLNNVWISGTDLKRKIHTNNDLKRFSGKKTVKFNCQSFSRQNRRFLKKPVLLASLQSNTGLLSLNKEKFLGQLHIVTSSTKQSCDVINETTIENYISSLLSKEMNSVWPIEALKAQAVAARTYALHMMRSKRVSRELGVEAYYDLESSEKHQVGGNFFDATTETRLASRKTEGLVLLTKKGTLTPAFFHAKCGGRTLRPEQVWDNRVAGYKEGVLCPFCDGRGKRTWNGKLKFKRFKKFLIWARKKQYLKRLPRFKKGLKVRVAPDNRFRNNIRLYVGGNVYKIPKPLFRKYFGRVIVPSNNFKLKYAGGKFVMKGEGLGHGVGMCQIGALDLAKKGWGYKKILAHYFPGHKIKKVY